MKYQIIVFCFLLRLLDFENKEERLVNVVPDMNPINESFIE